MLRNLAMVCIMMAFYLVTFAQTGFTSQAIEGKRCELATTQLEMNECAAAASEKAETEMSELYAQLLARASQKPMYRAKVETAQKAWLAYRDAELELKYPAEDKRTEYGSVYPMCFANDRRELTRERIAEIRALLKQTDDVCAGEWAREQTK
jgi:uncharacterized protein YecT (DUF1311 family)